MSSPDSTILLVDDDPNDCLLFERAFRRANLPHALVMIRSTEEARNYLTGTGDYQDRTKHPMPSLLLLDLKIPRMTGFEFLVWIKQHPSLRRLVIIVFSASSRKADMQAAYGLGANGYLFKPVESSQLVEVIKAMAGYWLRCNRFSALLGKLVA